MVGMFVSPQKADVATLTPKHDSIKRLGLWEVLKLQGLSPQGRE